MRTDFLSTSAHEAINRAVAPLEDPDDISERERIAMERLELRRRPEGTRPQAKANRVERRRKGNRIAAASRRANRRA